MKKNYWFWLGAGLLTVIILFVGFQQWQALRPSAGELTTSEARILVETKYKGKVTEINQEGEQYVINMVRDNFLYKIKMGISSGEVLSVDKVEIQTSVPLNEQKGGQQKTVDNTEKQPRSDTRITEDEAVQIALTQVSGKVDEVELETEDDFPYYLVDIDTDDEREAVIQIHAFTGEVLSVTWDD